MPVQRGLRNITRRMGPADKDVEHERSAAFWNRKCLSHR